MNSMTGYGHGEADLNGKKVVVDIKSVNGRFLDCTVKMPKSFLSLEDSIKSRIKEVISRGTIDIFLTITKSDDESVDVKLNEALSLRIYEESSKLASALNLPHGLTIKDLLRIEGVMTMEVKELDVEEYSPLIDNAVSIALEGLIKMRTREGENLKDDLLSKFSQLQSVVDKITEEIPKAINTYREKMYTRIAEALSSVEIDETRLVNEVAFFVDKSDVNEEITRLNSHIAQAIKLINENNSCGKQLEFISQEITREINTTGSKSPSLEITNWVLEAKNINESIKEQIRNVE